MAARVMSRWVVAALVFDLALAVVDATVSSSRLLTSSYLIPALAVALVASAEQTALVAVVSLLLAVASGAWHDFLFTAPHLYRLGVVLAGGAIAVAGALLRTNALAARDRMELLGEVARIADGRRDIGEALACLAELLVPDIADGCAIVSLERDVSPTTVVRLGQSAGDYEHRLTQWLDRMREDEMVLRARALEEARLVDLLDPAVVDDAEGRTLLGEIGFRTAVIAPVRVDETTLALLVLAFGPSARRYGQAELRFGSTVASRAALAIQNAQLFIELLEARQRMDAVIGSLADPVMIREPSGKLTYANDAAVRELGFGSLSDLLERGPEALFEEQIVTDEHGRPLEFERMPAIRVLRGEDPEPLTVRTVDPVRGDERWRVVKATPLRDSLGNLEAAVTIIEDISASKRAELQTSFLARASDVLASSLDYEETLRNVAWLAVPEIADWCAVDLVGEEGGRRRVVVAHRDPEKLELAERLREYEDADRLDPDRGLGRVVRTGESQLLEDIPLETLEAAARDEEHLRLIQQLGMRSGLIVPLRTAGRIVGAMTLVNSDSGRRFTEEHVRFAEQIALRAGVAVENSRLYTQRSQIAMTLQQSLLPEALPGIDGWEIASLYRPASAGEAVEVGGDFYDAFATDEGWIMLIGDVTGKGVEAAAMTSLVRHGARFVGEESPHPERILARLDAALRQQPALSLCSALCLRIQDDQICLASAGHPLPLIVTDDGVRTIGESGSVLGAFIDSDWPTTEFTIQPDEVLLLYTDGVTDTVGKSGRFGEQRLHQTMAECGPLAVEELLTCLDKSLTRFQVGPQADDTAALALRRAPQPVAARLGERRDRAA
jgi:PAS domain S-box-containing protein